MHVKQTAGTFQALHPKKMQASCDVSLHQKTHASFMSTTTCVPYTLAKLHTNLAKHLVCTYDATYNVVAANSAMQMVVCSFDQ
jgi:hypothetical protein